MSKRVYHGSPDHAMHVQSVFVSTFECKSEINTSAGFSRASICTRFIFSGRRRRMRERPYYKFTLHNSPSHSTNLQTAS
jgi:hypothetical protein